MGERAFRIATRSSPLARWQADHIADLLRGMRPDLCVEIVPVITEGDVRLDAPLSQIGGKGVFVKEVQAAVLEGRADIAVHSAKDLPAVTPDGLEIAAVPLRGDVRDALVGSRLVDLPADAVVATGSARRRIQMSDLRPDLRFVDLRGNMATRLAAVEHVDAVVVAAVALQRLDLKDRIADLLAVNMFVPQVGQGALAVECRVDDAEVRRCLAAIEHVPSRRAVDCERAFLFELGGDCTLPAGAHAEVLESGELHVRGVLAVSVDSPLRPARGALTGADGATLGAGLAAELRLRVTNEPTSP